MHRYTARNGLVGRYSDRPENSEVGWKADRPLLARTGGEADGFSYMNQRRHSQGRKWTESDQSHGVGVSQLVGRSQRAFLSVGSLATSRTRDDFPSIIYSINGRNRANCSPWILDTLLCLPSNASVAATISNLRTNDY